MDDNYEIFVKVGGAQWNVLIKNGVAAYIGMRDGDNSPYAFTPNLKDFLSAESVNRIQEAAIEEGRE